MCSVPDGKMSMYLQTLQMWSKWNENTREVFKGDIVIIKDDNQPRNCWLLAVVRGWSC